MIKVKDSLIQKVICEGVVYTRYFVYFSDPCFIQPYHKPAHFVYRVPISRKLPKGYDILTALRDNAIQHDDIGFYLPGGKRL